jgi:hypothetical protein
MKTPVLLSLSIFYSLLLYPTLVGAVGHVPAGPNTIVASWPAPDIMQDDNSDLAFIASLIEQGQYPGQANLNYGRAKALLQPLLAKAQFDPQVWYLWARVLQYQHQFTQAQAALDLVLRHQPAHVNSLLLKANIHLVLDQPQQARQTCLQLLAQTDILLVSTCALEAASYQGKLSASYQQLTKLREQFSVEDKTSQLWMAQVLADMAVRLGKLTEAQQLLARADLPTLPLSYIVQWADVQLALGNYASVNRYLSDIVKGSNFVDDALLLRLAIAEKHLSLDNDSPWQKQTSARVEIREQRQDSSHAADLARFYIEVSPDPVKAEYWASLNWQFAKLPADAQLLRQASTMQNNWPQQDKPNNRQGD